MIFTEFRFLFFFLAVFLIYWRLEDNWWRKLWLLGCSYVFYAAWDWRFLSLILVSTLVDYIAGRRMAALDDRLLRKRWLLASLITNLGLLGFFKYFNFFIASAAELLAFLGLPASPTTLEIVLPVGISFYTFQTLSYTIDVYRRKIPAEPNLLNLALFVAFFPQLVAGPIVRASQFLPQLGGARSWRTVDVRAALVLFMVGYFKKACVSDNISPFVDLYYADPAGFSVASCWVALLLFPVQIYCDFSGYSDMAIACAALLGYRLPLNFDFPYFSPNVTEAWRRWHISLTSWLRDYLLMPLAHSGRGNRFLQQRSLMVTMLLCGLWHGASWTFVVWGGLHGLALVVERAWRRRRGRKSTPRTASAAVGVALVFGWVVFTMILFRSPDLPTALTVLQLAAGFGSAGREVLGPGLFVVFGALAVAHWVSYRRWLVRSWQRIPDWAFAAGYGAAVAFALATTRPNPEPFIYFQF